MRILSIETSCDETSLALVEAKGGLRAPKFKILKHFISSQIKIHALYGGVVPNLAKREHIKNLPILYRKIFGTPLQATNYKPQAVDLLTVTVGPGLEPALWTGIEFAKELHHKLQTTRLAIDSSKRANHELPFVGANHLHGHMYSFLLPQKENSKFEIRNSKFPAIALLVSGGHTILVLMKNLHEWKRLGETRDDAVGEAFDKVARLLGLPYPGGPALEKLARKGNKNSIQFPRPMLSQKNYDFSFSGLKTAVLYHLRSEKRGERSKEETANIAASFQEAAIDVLVKKTMRAAETYGAKSIILSGGVAANRALQKSLERESKKLGAQFFTAQKEYHGDNAAMIAAAGYFAYLKNKKLPLKANGSLSI